MRSRAGRTVNDRVGRHGRAWLALAACGALATAALAQSGSATFAVPRESIDGGAGRSTSATYALHGTLGQPDAGAPMSSASFQLRGGFHRAAPQSETIFSNGFEG